MENYHNATYVVMIDRPLSPHPFYLKKKVGMGWEKNEFGERVFENWNAQVGYGGDRKEARGRWKRPPPPLKRINKIYIWIMKIKQQKYLPNPSFLDNY